VRYHLTAVQYESLLAGDPIYPVINGGEYEVTLTSSQLDDLSAGSAIATSACGQQIEISLPQPRDRAIYSSAKTPPS
jgi:hypothetical protein